MRYTMAPRTQRLLYLTRAMTYGIYIRCWRSTPYAADARTIVTQDVEFEALTRPFARRKSHGLCVLNPYPDDDGD